MAEVETTGVGNHLAWGAFLLPIAWVCLDFVYWPAVLAAGLLPTNADSIIIPIFNDIIAAPFFMLFLLFWSWPAWRVPRSRIVLSAWNPERPWVSWLATLFYGGIAVLVAADAVHTLFLHPVELLTLIVTIPFALWNLLLRAAVVQPPVA